MKAGCCILRVVGWALVSAVVASLALFLAARPTNRVLGRWTQPDSIEYAGCPVAYVRLLEGEPDLRGFPMHIGRKYYVYAGQDSSATYGHLWPVDLYADAGTAESVIAACTVEWSDSGFVFCTGSGHRIFIPRIMFTNGR